MALPTSATQWAWQALSQTQVPLQAAHRLTLLAAAHTLDQSVAAAAGHDGDMFHHDVLAVAVTGITGSDIAAAIGVTDRTATLYLRRLATAGLMHTHDSVHFAPPGQAWQSASRHLTGPVT